MGAIYNIQIFTIFLSILVLYMVIVCGFHRYSKETELTNQSTANRQMLFERERNLWKGTAIVICAFLLSFLPWFISQLITLLCLPCHRNLWLLLLFNAFVRHFNVCKLRIKSVFVCMEASKVSRYIQALAEKANLLPWQSRQTSYRQLC